MTRFDVTAIGEGGLRLSVPRGTRIERTTSFDVNIAATEANVLAGLSSLGHRTSWISALPQTPMAQRVEYQLRSFGIDTSGVVHAQDGRLGTYYVEYGAAPRPTQVYFDRSRTAFTQMTAADVDWDIVLDTRLLHLTGITAALSPSVMAILLEALDRAESAGVPVSFDVNYRANLWDTSTAATALEPFLRRAEILFVRSEDVHVLFGTENSAPAALAAVKQMSSARHIVVTCGDLGVHACLDGRLVEAPARTVDIVDRLGAGDGFAAGFLHAWLDGDLDKAPATGTAMAALALAQSGEQVITDRTELASILNDPQAQLRR